MQLAKRFYGRAGLAQELSRNAVIFAAPSMSEHASVARQGSLDALRAGELDYLWAYESTARAAHLPFVRLPTAINLSDPREAATYGRATVRIAGRAPGDSILVRGEPILYGLTILRGARHSSAARRFIAYLFGPLGVHVLRGAGLPALDTPRLIGTVIPPALRKSQ